MWNQLLVILLGLWLTASPGVMQYEGPERTNNHIVGPLVVSAAIIALAEATRAMRWVNVTLGAWLIVAPALLGYDPLHIGVRSSLVGAAILALSLIEGPRRARMGGGWPRLWRTPPEEAEDGREWRKTG
ncbi:SPW repeat domain-containing protein [Nitrospira moscoviensis]|uniref:Vitamin K epoxide reductase n=1 Tax=Nitrospira moscoviensis TaxID=42253 RepID=A0A0K2GEH6_NITMO|nr:SPW repeat protein [Nitrospira moscoviensis]ALA58997.1 Vitamin K epoxide reductase [Nitrospira moscoviensis]